MPKRKARQRSEKPTKEKPIVTLSKDDKAALLKLDEDLMTITGEAVS